MTSTSPHYGKGRRRGLTMLAVSMAIAVGSQALPAVAAPVAGISPAAQAAEAPSTDEWDAANIVAADAITPGERVSKGSLDAKRNVVWGYLSFADRGTMEADDMRGAWRDTAVPAGIDVYMRYDTGGGKMSRIHKATTHVDDLGNTVYAFTFQDGTPTLAGGTWKDGSADVQLLIGKDNVAENSAIGEPMAAVRVTPGGAWYSGSVADSRNMNWSIHPVAVNDKRGPMWGETLVKLYQVSPAATGLKGQLSATADKAVARTYTGRVWNESMKGNNTENVWKRDAYNINVDNGVLFDGTDTPAKGHTVYQAVPNDAAYQALDAIRRETNPDNNRQRADIQSRMQRMADYVRTHPENFTVYSAKVSEDGTYTLRSSFDQARHADYVYMWVEDGEGNIKTNLSAWNTPEFRAPVGNDVYTEQGHTQSSLSDQQKYSNGHVPGQAHLGDNASVATAPHRDGGGNWSNVDFALATNQDGTGHTVKPGETDPKPDTSDADTYDPSYDPAQGKPGVGTKVDQTVKVPKGTKFEPTLPEGWTATEADEGGDFTVTPAENARPGTVKIPVLVTYPDGSQETVTTPFTVLPLDKDENDPRYEDAVTPPGESTIIAPPKNPDGSDLPDDSTFAPGEHDVPGKVEVDPDTGEITVTPDEDATPGDYEIPVVITYPDGSTDTPTVTITVPKDTGGDGSSDQAADNDPGYGTTEGTAGEETKVAQNGDRELPDGTKITVADAPEGWVFGEPNEVGDFTVTPDADTLDGTRVTIPVRFAYPDGTIDDTTAVFVVSNDASANDPSYKETEAPRGKDTLVDAPTNPDGSPLPEGSTFAPGESDDPDFPGKVEIDPDTGEVTLTPDEDATPDDYIIPVEVTYPDGTTEIIDLPVRVPDDSTVTPPGGDGSDDGSTDAADNDPAYSPGSGPAGSATELKQDGDRELPEGTKFVLPKPPAGWSFGEPNEHGDFTVTPPESALPGTKVSIPVTVVYPDGSSEIVNAPFEVVGSSDDAKDNDPTYPDDTKVKPGETEKVDPPRNPDGSTLPDDTKFEKGDTDLPGTVEVDPDTGEITVTPNEDAKPGKHTVTVEITYPDGSTDTVDVPIEVLPADDGDDTEDTDPTPDADNNTPGYKDQEGLAGTPVEFAQSGDRELPEGTKFIFPRFPSGWTIEGDEKTGDFTITSPKGTPNGTKVAIPIIVSYPDGSTASLEPVLKVTSTSPGTGDTDGGEKPGTPGDGGDGDNDGDDGVEKQDPTYGDDRTETPREKDTVIEGPKNKDGSDLPEDTTFKPGEHEFPGKVEVDPNTGEVTVTPDKDAKGGNYDIPVVVTFPDGQSVTITVPVRVPPKAGDGAEVEVSPGDTVIIGGDVDPKDLQIRFPDGSVKDISELNPTKDKDGNITITVPKDWADGTYIVETKDGTRVVVLKVRSAQSDGETKTGSSELSDRCIAGLAGVGIPLLLLIPLGVATQVAIPGLEGFRSQAGKAIEQVNTQIQQQLGIFNEQFATALGKNFPARELGTAAAGLALTVLGLLIADQIAQACAPGYDGLSSKIGGGEGGKAQGSSAQGSSAQEDAKKNEEDEN